MKRKTILKLFWFFVCLLTILGMVVWTIAPALK